VAVDASGNVRALVGAGNAWITASSGSLPAATVLVTIAQPVAGAQLLADSQIVAGPTPADPNAAPAVGNPYEVLLRGVPTLTVGNLVIASESANVAGRVLSVQPEGADQRVRLVAVPPTQLFTDFAFRDTVDLGALGLIIPAELTARYDVVQNGRTYVFTPRPGVSHARERPTALGETPPPPPFTKCETVPNAENGRPLPLALSIPPTFEVVVDGSVRRELTPAGTRITLTGQPKFKLNAGIEIRAAFEAKISCRMTLGRTPPFRAPVAWASFLGGEVEFGVGFELGGKLTVASPKLGAAMKLDTSLNAVLDCPAAPAICSLTGTATGTPTFEPQFTAPALAQAQAEAALSLIGFATLDLGSADFQALQVSAIEVRMGPEFSATLTAEALQIANLDADTGRSKYALAFKSEIAPGVKLGEILAVLGASEAAPLKIAFSGDLGGSPKATSVVADRARYLPGERASVVVKLDPASTRFPQELLYNVERVELRRMGGRFGTEVLAQQNANEGQAEFSLAFDSPGLVDVGEILAFVFTKTLSLVPLSYELAAAQCVGNCGALELSPASVTLNAGASQQFTATFAGVPTTTVLWSASGGNIDATGLYTAPAQGGSFTVTAISDTIAGVHGSAAVTVPVQAARFQGTLTLESIVSNARLVNRTRITVSVVAEVDSRGVLVLREVSGTGNDTFAYDSSASFNCVGGSGTNRPDEVTTGAVTLTGTSFGGVTDGVPGATAIMVPRVTGTKTSNSCSDSVWTNRTEAVTGEALNGGVFTGTVVVVDGETRTIDFNRDFDDGFGRRTVTTGQLTRSP